MTSKAESLMVAHFELSIVVPFRLWASEWKHGEPPSLDELHESQFEKDGVWNECAQIRDDAGWAAAREYQSSAYFHPFVRQFLKGREHVRRLYRDDVAEVTFSPDASPHALTRTIPVTDCLLWLFSSGIGVLQLDLRAQIDKDCTCWSLRDVQLALDQLRRLYPPYFFGNNDGPSGGGHCPKSVEFSLKDGSKFFGDLDDHRRFVRESRDWLATKDARAHSFPWAQHWRSLLLPIVTTSLNEDVPPSGMHALQLGDDRAVVMSLVAFKDRSTLKAVDRGNWVRLCFADTPGTEELPYQREFLARFEERCCYDRFWYQSGESEESPSRIINCGYAFTWAGSVCDTKYFMNERDGALATFRHIYVPMGVIAHFHRAALLAASAQLSELSERRDVDTREVHQERLQKLYQRFITFTQVFWFDEISPQEQGRELFANWRRELRTQELFSEVRQELRDMTDLQHTRAQIDQARKATWLSEIALPFVVITVAASLVSMLAAFFGMNTIDFPNKVNILSCSEWRCVLNWIVFLPMMAVLFLVAPFVIWKRKWILDRFLGRRASSDD